MAEAEGRRQDHGRRPIAGADAQPAAGRAGSAIIDISGLAELRQAERIGRRTRDRRLRDPWRYRGRTDTRCDARRDAAGRRRIAYRAVRNRGTIGGSLSHADPAADWVSALSALGAKVRCAACRRIEISRSRLHHRRARIRAAPGESSRPCVSGHAASARWGYVKACRKTGEFAHAIGAVLIDPEAGNGARGDRRARSAPIVLADAHRRCSAAITGDFKRSSMRGSPTRCWPKPASRTPSTGISMSRCCAARSPRRRHDRRSRSPSTRRRQQAVVEPRTHLADFLRDNCNLTGTHLGCEHGVCGACTLLLDDMPARSCITYAVACDGARVTTIEGLDNDEIATELRAAFTASTRCNAAIARRAC
jgi:hypothetical protein